MIRCLIKQSPKEQLMSLVPVWQAWLLPLLSPGAVDPCALFKRSSLVLVLQLGQETFSPTFSSTNQNVLELVHILGIRYVRATPGQPFRDNSIPLPRLFALSASLQFPSPALTFPTGTGLVLSFILFAQGLLPFNQSPLPELVFFF